MTEKLKVVSDNPDIVHGEVPDSNIFQFNPASVEELRKQKLIREQEETIDLEYVSPGEERVGTCTEIERALYIEMATTHVELAAMYKELVARAMEIYAESIRGTDTPLDAERMFMNSAEKVFPSAEDAEAYYALNTRHEYVRAYFNYCIRERLGHASTYGVRRDFVIVRTGNKYKLPK